MIFNCIGCGVSISSNRKNCPYCKIDNIEHIEVLTGIAPKTETTQWRDRVKGSILSYVLRKPA